MLEALQYWSDPCLLVDPLSFIPPSPSLTTDASNHGWMAVLEGQSRSGTWAQEESHFHVYILKTLTVFMVSNRALIHPGVLLVQTDNTTVLSYGMDHIPLAQLTCLGDYSVVPQHGDHYWGS